MQGRMAKKQPLTSQSSCDLEVVEMGRMSSTQGGHVIRSVMSEGSALESYMSQLGMLGAILSQIDDDAQADDESS